MLEALPCVPTLMESFWTEAESGDNAMGRPCVVKKFLCIPTKRTTVGKFMKSLYKKGLRDKINKENEAQKQQIQASNQKTLKKYK